MTGAIAVCFEHWGQDITLIKPMLIIEDIDLTYIRLEGILAALFRLFALV